MTTIDVTSNNLGQFYYECFECGTTFIVPLKMSYCYNCEERDNFYLME